MGGQRPTVAQLKAAESAVKQACDATDRAHGERLKALSEAEAARQALNELRETAVPEATALAGCIKAICARARESPLSASATRTGKPVFARLLLATAKWAASFFTWRLDMACLSPPSSRIRSPSRAGHAADASEVLDGTESVKAS